MWYLFIYSSTYLFSENCMWLVILSYYYYYYYYYYYHHHHHQHHHHHHYLFILCFFYCIYFIFFIFFNVYFIYIYTKMKKNGELVDCMGKKREMLDFCWKLKGFDGQRESIGKKKKGHITKKGLKDFPKQRNYRKMELYGGILRRKSKKNGEKN